VSEPPPYRTATLRLSDPPGRAAWAELLAGSPQRSPYAEIEFAEAVEQAEGWPATLCGVWDSETERLRAGCITFRKRRGPYSAAALPSLARLSPLLLDGPVDAAEVHRGTSPLDALLDLLASDFDQVNLLLPASVADLRPLSWKGWQVKPTYTYQIHLGDKEDILARWSSTPRRRFRQSEADFVVEEDRAAVAEVVDITIAAHARQDARFPLSRDQAIAMAQSLVETGHVRPFVARRNRAVEAGILILSNDAEAHYWLAGSLPGDAMTVLLGIVLQRLQEEGVETFDFAGANTPGIAEFKRKFAPRLVMMHRARFIGRVELRLLDRLLDRF